MLSSKIVKPLQFSFSTLPTSAWPTPTTHLSFKADYHQDKMKIFQRVACAPVLAVVYIVHDYHIIVTTEPKKLDFSWEFYARRKRLGA